MTYADIEPDPPNASVRTGCGVSPDSFNGYVCTAFVPPGTPTQFGSGTPDTSPPVGLGPPGHLSRTLAKRELRGARCPADRDPGKRPGFFVRSGESHATVKEEASLEDSGFALMNRSGSVRYASSMMREDR